MQRPYSVAAYSPERKSIYYRALCKLHEQNKIHISIYTSKPIYFLLVKLNNHFALVRMLRKLITGKSNSFPSDPSWSAIFQGLAAPFTMLTTHRIVAAFQAYSPVILYLWLLKILGKKIIFYTSWPYWHTTKYIKKPLPFMKPLWHVFLRRVPSVAVTRAAQSSLQKINPSAYYIPHTVDTTLFHPQKKQSATTLQLLFVGRLTQEKGILTIIEALEQLTPAKKMHCTFVGDGPLREIIIHKAKTLPITYLGHIANEKQLAKIYASSDIFIMASSTTEKWEEWFGITVIEAMASGCSVITNDCIGPREHIQHMKTGLVISQQNPAALRKAIELLMKNKSLRQKLSKAAREYAVQHYDATKLSEQWMRVLEMK